MNRIGSKLVLKMVELFQEKALCSMTRKRSLKKNFRLFFASMKIEINV